MACWQVLRRSTRGMRATPARAVEPPLPGRPRAGGGGVRVARLERHEAGQALVRVVQEARLAHLAVGDDVEADVSLPAHDCRSPPRRRAPRAGPRRRAWPLTRARMRARMASGRGRLPTCVVRIRSVLVFILVPSAGFEESGPSRRQGPAIPPRAASAERGGGQNACPERLALTRPVLPG